MSIRIVIRNIMVNPSFIHINIDICIINVNKMLHIIINMFFINIIIVNHNINNDIDIYIMNVIIISNIRIINIVYYYYY